MSTEPLSTNLKVYDLDKCILVRHVRVNPGKYGQGGKYGQMAYNSNVQEHSSVTKNCFISAQIVSIRFFYTRILVYHLILTLCNEDFSSTSGTTPA